MSSKLIDINYDPIAHEYVYGGYRISQETSIRYDMNCQYIMISWSAEHIESKQPPIHDQQTLADVINTIDARYIFNAVRGWNNE